MTFRKFLFSLAKLYSLDQYIPEENQWIEDEGNLIIDHEKYDNPVINKKEEIKDVDL